MAYPNTLDSFTTKVDGVDTYLAAHMNAVQTSIVAIEAALGINIAGTMSSLAARLAVSINNDGSLNTSGISSLPANSVNTAAIQNQAVTAAKIANATITATQIANNTVTATQIANNTITAAQVANATLGSTQITPGGIVPDSLGLTVWNATGSTLTAGQLVYVSGYSAANSMPQVSLAVNNIAGSSATYIVTASIANGTSGVVRRHWTSTATLNTGTASVGAPVYQDSTAGGWTLTQPTAASSRQQIVGRVIVGNATVGQIEFDLVSNGEPIWGTVDLPADWGGRHFSDTGGSPPAAAAGANAGTSPPTPVVAAGSNDSRGQITFGTGAGAAAGAQVGVTFAAAYAAAPFVLVSPANAAAASLQICAVSVTTAGFTLSTNVSPAPSQPNSAYPFNYWVVG